MKRKIATLTVIIFIFTISLSGCVLEDIYDESATDSRTLGHMFNNYKDFSFQNAEEGETIKRIDTVKDAKYLPNRNITKVWMKSYSRRPILFKGDLTTNYYIMPDDAIEYNVTVMEQNGIEYIKDFWSAQQ